MKNQKKFLTAALVLMAAWSILQKKSGNKKMSAAITAPAPDAGQAGGWNGAGTADDSVREPASNKESLKTMAGILRKFARPENNLKGLVERLREEMQEPVVSYNANEDTGEMAIVRTNNPLPGTRYFHAQYFGDGSGQGFAQHMSFEFQPGPTAMNDVVSSMKDAFGLADPAVQRDGYMKWELDHGYTLWIKRLDQEDLQDNPFNAYTQADIGSVRAVIEPDVHSEN